MAKKQQRPTSWPIPEHAMREFRKRKELKGIPITRSIEDALRVALEDGVRRLWF